MVEIFSVASGQSDATRSVGNDLVLTAPSKIYFGGGTPGIAFFEKSGSDLKVTLLDGQEVMLRGFFGIGPAGEFSALLDGGAGGSVEVTGLIAPEPFTPAGTETATATVMTAEIDRSPAEPTPAAPAAAEPQASETQTGTPTGAPTETVVSAGAVDAADAGGGAAPVPTFGGFGVDRLLFAAGYIPALFRFTSNKDGDDTPPSADPAAAPAAAPVADDAEDEAVADADTPAAETPAAEATDPDSGLPAEIAALLRGDVADDLAGNTDLAAAFAPRPTQSDFADSGFGAGPDLIGSLMDDLSNLPPLG